MTITIHASFVVDSLDDLHECLTAVRELEPDTISFEGELYHHESEADPEPVEPIHTADTLCTDPFCPIAHDTEPEVHEWTELADDREMDLTPPQGIERPTDQVRAREAYLSALVMWTRENITEGPITLVDDGRLRETYRTFLQYGPGVVLYSVTPTELSCLRGAFKDATAGKVPIR